MRPIRKRATEPQRFTRWRKQHAAKKPPPGWSKVSRGAMEALRSALLAEQLYLCCYCCGPLHLEDDSAHIEHLRPQGVPAYRHLRFDYQNLLASCTGVLAELEAVPERERAERLRAILAPTASGSLLGHWDAVQDVVGRAYGL